MLTVDGPGKHTHARVYRLGDTDFMSSSLGSGKWGDPSKFMCGKTRLRYANCFVFVNISRGHSKYFREHFSRLFAPLNRYMPGISGSGRVRNHVVHHCPVLLCTCEKSTKRSERAWGLVPHNDCCQDFLSEKLIQSEGFPTVLPSETVPWSWLQDKEHWSCGACAIVGPRMYPPEPVLIAKFIKPHCVETSPCRSILVLWLDRDCRVKPRESFGGNGVSK